MTMGDRIVILDGGELQQVGTPMQCYHEPANVFVAGFLGEPSMNFFDLENRDGTLAGDTFDYSLSGEAVTAVDGHTDVTLGVRPESIEIVDEVDDTTPDDVIPATVDVVEPHGDENAVHLHLGGEDGPLLTVMIDGMRYLAAGQDIGVRFPQGAVHLFDGTTGEALHNRRLTNVDQVEEIGTAQSV